MHDYSELIYPELSYKINGSLFETHNELGRYCNEKQYGDGIEKYFIKNRINYEREKILLPSFGGEKNNRNKVDFLVEGEIILEVKAKRFLEKEDYYQIKRYLTSANKKLGLLVNFRDNHLKPKRILNALIKS